MSYETKKYYLRDKVSYIARAIRRKKRIFIEIVLPLKRKACIDCGKKFPPVCMDFDHVRGVKEFQISTGYFHVSIKRLLKEIAKCEIVCANCHRIRTSKRVKGG